MQIKFGDERLPERFWKRIVMNAKTQCWEWQGATPHGYGRIYMHGKERLVHRVSYEAFVGPIPDKLVIDHLCRVRSCCNPKHLEAVTPQTNSLRSPLVLAMIAESAERSRSKTHCPKGHPYSGVNLILSKANRRVCRECQRLAMTAFYKKNADKRRAESRAYHAAHRDERNAVAMSYYHSNKKTKTSS